MQSKIQNDIQEYNQRLVQVDQEILKLRTQLEQFLNTRERLTGAIAALQEVLTIEEDCDTKPKQNEEEE